MTALSSRTQSPPLRADSPCRPSGLLLLTLSEALAGALGFLSTVHVARRLGPQGFASLEFAWSASAWLLVLVRGGVEVIVYREAARRPRLIRAWTAHLLGFRLASALLGYLLILALALLSARSSEAALLLLAGLIVWPSALVCDVGMRARARLHVPALAQSARACALALASWTLISGPLDLSSAALLIVLAELVSLVLINAAHRLEFGWPWPRFRRRLWLVLLHRGLLTTSCRFLRVGLYAADVLALGWLASGELGPYAAGRRIVFALLAVGLVIPGALAPVLARAWSVGTAPALRVYARSRARILALGCPCACGLALTSDRVLNTLFGPDYQLGAPWLVLLALRLPWLLLSGLDVSALVACRRERQALTLVGALSLLAVLLVPLSAIFAGAWGVAASLLLVEVSGAVAASRMLRSLGLSPAPFADLRGPALGCAALVLVCVLTASLPLFLTCSLGALTYAAIYRSQEGSREPVTEEPSE